VQATPNSASEASSPVRIIFIRRSRYAQKV